MKFTEQQRINNIGAEMVQAVTNLAKEFRIRLTKGQTFEAGGGYPELKVSAEQFRASLGENAKKIENFCDYVLDGKSNQIVKGKKRK